MGGWKTEIVEDPVTGKCSKSEYFNGFEKMKVKEEQTYLGDSISVDGTHTKNVQLRSNKGLGIINQIVQILDSTFFGKYHYEVAMVLRESLFLSSILLNSEAWVNYSKQDVRILEQCDEILLSKILDCDGNTSNALKYFELGGVPIRFEIMKRKLGFLQYLLKEDKESLIYNVLKATKENPLKNDFVKTCEKYLKILKIELSFEEIGNLSKNSFKKVIKDRVKVAAYSYLISEQEKQSKITDIKYQKLEMQAYLADGSRDTRLSKLIFKARGRTLDIKMDKRWKYDDTLCSGCNQKEETGEEVLGCDKLGENYENVPYGWFFEDSEKQLFAAKVMMKKLKMREKIREEVT